jgi:hypothetical protein
MEKYLNEMDSYVESREKIYKVWMKR